MDPVKQESSRNSELYKQDHQIGNNYNKVPGQNKIATSRESQRHRTRINQTNSYISSGSRVSNNSSRDTSPSNMSKRSYTNTNHSRSRSPNNHNHSQIVNQNNQMLPEDFQQIFVRPSQSHVNQRPNPQKFTRQYTDPAQAHFGTKQVQKSNNAIDFHWQNNQNVTDQIMEQDVCPNFDRIKKNHRSMTVPENQNQDKDDKFQSQQSTSSSMRRNQTKVKKQSSMSSRSSKSSSRSSQSHSRLLKQRSKKGNSAVKAYFGISISTLMMDFEKRYNIDASPMVSPEPSFTNSRQSSSNLSSRESSSADQSTPRLSSSLMDDNFPCQRANTQQVTSPSKIPVYLHKKCQVLRSISRLRCVSWMMVLLPTLLLITTLVLFVADQTGLPIFINFSVQMAEIDQDVKSNRKKTVLLVCNIICWLAYYFLGAIGLYYCSDKRYETLNMLRNFSICTTILGVIILLLSSFMSMLITSELYYTQWVDEGHKPFKKLVKVQYQVGDQVTPYMFPITIACFVIQVIPFVLYSCSIRKAKQVQLGYLNYLNKFCLSPQSRLARDHRPAMDTIIEVSSCNERTESVATERLNEMTRMKYLLLQQQAQMLYSNPSQISKQRQTHDTQYFLDQEADRMLNIIEEDDFSSQNSGSERNYRRNSSQSINEFLLQDDNSERSFT